VGRTLQAALELEKMGLSARVVEMHTIKPLDTDLIVRCAEETGALVTIEEHSIIGGLGGAVSETLSSCFPTPLERLGVPDTFAETGPYVDLLDKYGLSIEGIIQAGQRAVKRKRCQDVS
jgi:transketolase